MSKRDATLHDVARAVGVSPRTVSRVVNREGGFSANTEARVREAITALGYRPNLLARGLIQGRSGTLALIGPTMTDPFFPELAEGVQRAARAHGLTMFLASTDGDPEQQRDVLDRLQQYAVDGAIIFPVAETAGEVAALTDLGLRVVTIDLPSIRPDVPTVRSAIADGARQAVSHLRARDCKRIVFLNGNPNPGGRREQGYQAIVGDEAAVFVADATSEGGATAMRDALDRLPGLDGVFAYNDLMAIGALGVLAERGLAVPDDVAVVGFDDIAVSAVLHPSLTTVGLDLARIGTEAVNCVVAMSNGEAPPAETVIPVELVVRDSA